MDATHETVRGALATASTLRREIQRRIHLAGPATRLDWRQLEANVLEVECAARLRADEESRGLLARAIVRLRALYASLDDADG